MVFHPVKLTQTCQKKKTPWRRKISESTTVLKKKETKLICKQNDFGMLKLNTLRNTLLVLIHPEIKVGSLNLGTLSRQAAFPTGCEGRPEPSHLAIRLVKEAFDTYSSLVARRDVIWMKFVDAKKNSPRRNS